MTKREYDNLEQSFSLRVEHRKPKLVRRTIEGFVKIHDEEYFLDTCNDLGAEEKNDLQMTGLSSPVYSFPRWEKERLKLFEIASELEECYGDTVERQIELFNLKSSIKQLRGKVDLGSRGFLRTLNMCYDALQNIKAEKLKKKQVKALKFVLRNIDENIDDFYASELEGILIDSGLKPIPEVEGIASLYEEH